MSGLGAVSGLPMLWLLLGRELGRLALLPRWLTPTPTSLGETLPRLLSVARGTPGFPPNPMGLSAPLLPCGYDATNVMDESLASFLWSATVLLTGDSPL